MEFSANHLARRAVGSATAIALGTALALAPVTIGAGFDLDLSSAIADPGNGQGNGGGNGGGHGGGNGNGNGGGNGGGSSAAAAGGGHGNGKGGNSPGSSTTIQTAGNGASNGGGASHGRPTRTDLSARGLQHYQAALARWEEQQLKGGSLASRRGALNAAHASPTALRNAALNSRVGLIAAYQGAYNAAMALSEEYDAKAAALEAMAPPDEEAMAAAEALVGELTKELDEALEDPAAAPRSAEEVEADLKAAEEELDGLMAEAEAYNAAQRELNGLAEELAAAQTQAQQSLVAAANKPVDQEVQDSVNDLLSR